MIQTVASFFDWCLQEMTSDKGPLGVMVGAFVVSQAAMLVPPPILGGIALGLLAGTTIVKGYIQQQGPDMDHVITKSDPVVEKEIVPYDKWPDECYVCRSDIPDNMEVRGQFVIHKGESDAETKAVPLCESCTWSYSTLIDNSDKMVKIFDERGEPTEL